MTKAFKSSCLTSCFIALLFYSCEGQSVKKSKNNMEEHHQYTNHLIHESSPYLLQHAHNPVNWYPWGDEALQKAIKENKMLLISIGYAACHWCHVMEHESFEDTLVAKIMNDHFVSIKVDREERADIDNIYMNAAYLVSGRGGWPLNVIALPDGRPVYAGTYFPKEDWVAMLNYYVGLYANQRDDMIKQADQLTNGIQGIELVPKNTNIQSFNLDELADPVKAFVDIQDKKLGGRMGAPKFPMPNNYRFLMQYHYLSGNQDALNITLTALDHMARGGIYDQVGGGFARYSTDKFWLVPHFEKMTYDNGQLLSLYSYAYQLTKNPLYKSVVDQTLDFVNREMTSNEGGFYSSLDADSDGEEGKFYVWKKQEVDSLLEDDAFLFEAYYDISEKGNWEHGKNILRVTEAKESFAKEHQLSIDELEKLLERGRDELLKARASRVRPALDDKILTSWNALMLMGYVDAYRVFDEAPFLQAALKNAWFITKNQMQEDGRLNRNYKDGISSINAFLDDYALTAEAFIDLYQATFDETWLTKAKILADYAIAHFHDATSGMFFYTSDIDQQLIARKMEISDNVIPASNSSMAKVLYELGMYYFNEDYLAMSSQMLNNVKSQIHDNLGYYNNWAILEAWLAKEPYEVAIVGRDHQKLRKEFDTHYLPNVFLSGGKNEGNLELLQYRLIKGQTTIYVCQDKVCQMPVIDVDEALNQLH